MADKKPLFMSTEGYQEELAFTDDVQLGKLTINASGTGIVMNSKPITGLPNTPPSGDAATNKNYVDSVAQGLAPKDPAVAVATAQDGNITLSGLPVIDDLTTLVDGDRVLLTAQTDPIENGLWVVHGSRASLDLEVPGTLIDTVVEAIAGGTGGNSITIAFAADGSGAGNITRSGTDFTFHYESAVTTVANFEAAVAALAGGDKLIRVKTAGTAGNVLTDPGDTFTATSLAGGAASAFTRPTDFAAGSSAKSAFAFVQQGTDYADTGWVCTTNSPADIVGTNALAFVQFSAAGIVTASTGLTKIGNDIRVKPGDGIEVTSNGASTNVNLSPSNPCLSLAGTAGSKTLEVKVVSPGSGVGGIEKTANGLQVDLDGTTLQLLAGGLSVLGLPQDFQINGTATHYDDAGVGNVSAANLDTLTAGSSSNADALHTHASSPATEAPKIENTLLVGEAIAVADPVYFTGTANRIGKSDTVDPKAYVIGVARTAQATPGSSCEVVTAGPCAGVLSGATAGDRYYLQDGGGIGTTIPGGGKRIIQVGIAINGTDLFVRIVDFGKKAA